MTAEMISQSPSSQQSACLVIGIQGGQGSFNEEAVGHYIQKTKLEAPTFENFAIKYLYTSKGVMEALCQGEISRGQCAIYNSTGGYVEETTSALEKYPVQIVEQFEIKIAHALMIRPEAHFSEITTVMGHPQVFAQCRETLKQKYPHLKQVSGEGDLVDNAKAAEWLGSGKLPSGTAVMGSRHLAEIYGLQVVEDNLQDLKENYTRFILVEKSPDKSAG